MLWVILWPNLMFIVCRPLFQEDLEDICDRITMKKGNSLIYTCCPQISSCSIRRITLFNRLRLQVFVFAVILLMRCVFFRNTIFPKGMLWGLLLITPFLGKVRILHEMDSLGGFFVYWDILCCERLVVRLGYVFGIVLCAGGIYCRRRRLNRVIRRMEQEEI